MTASYIDLYKYGLNFSQARQVIVPNEFCICTITFLINSNSRGAEEHYTRSNNKTRSESIDQAAKMDIKVYFYR